MRVIAILSLVTAAVLLVAAPATAQDDWIGVYGDDEAGTCRINDTPGLVYVYVFHQGSTPALGSQFRVSASAGMTMSLISTTVNPSFLSIGSPESGIAFSYTSCQSTFPLQLLTLLYFGSGTTPSCETIDIVPSPQSETGSVEIVDCSIQTLPVSSSQAIVNPNLFCLCTGEPSHDPVTTVTTVPAGRTVTVDGTDYTAPRSFRWTPGDLHQIGVPSPQGPADSMLVFSGWSDGGAQTHTITAPAQNVTFTATLSLAPRFTIATSPPGLTVEADGQTYTAPKNLYWAGQTAHTVGTTSPQPGVDSAYAFVSWSDGGDLTHSVTAPGVDATLTATFAGIPNEEPGFIGLYSDPAGSSCELTDDSGAQLRNVYVVHRGFGGAVKSRFRVRSGGGFGGTYVGEYSALTTTGNTQTGLQAYYGGCKTAEIAVTRIDYLCYGDSDPCSFLEVTPDPAATSGLIEVRDCSGNIPGANSSRLSVNPDGECACGERELATRSVLITTEPPGLNITIDGTAYPTPKHFDWLETSTHSVEALSQQNNRGFLAWSDGGARAHSFEVGASDIVLAATYYTLNPVQGIIGLYTDTGAQGCNLVDPTFTTVNVEVVHTGDMLSNTSQFRVAASPGMTMISSGVTYHIGLHLGDIMNGVVITYIGCQTPPLHLATLSYFGLGSSAPCSYFEVLPDPSAASGKIEIVDCGLAVWEGLGGRLTVNGDESCPCGPPEIPPPAATVTTTPVGLTVTVDGQPYTSPHEFTWTPGTVHTVIADSSQAYGSDSVAVYSYWSDGGARSHQVTMPGGDVTFRATHDVRQKTVSGVGDTPIPAVVVLGQNAPNPFNPTTRIEFSIPEAREVQLCVYDVAGRLVRRLYEGRAPRGFTAITWDGVNGSGQSVSSGVYFYRLQVGETTLTKKMVLIK